MFGNVRLLAGRVAIHDHLASIASLEVIATLAASGTLQQIITIGSAHDGRCLMPCNYLITLGEGGVGENKAWR